MKSYKSIMPVRIYNGSQSLGWGVRLRLKCGDEKFLFDENSHYSLNQAQYAADSMRRDIINHGLSAACTSALPTDYKIKA